MIAIKKISSILDALWIQASPVTAIKDWSIKFETQVGQNLGFLREIKNRNLFIRQQGNSEDLSWNQWK